MEIYLSVYYKGNLTEEIKYFCKLRNKCVHRLYEHSIIELEKEISKEKDRFYCLLYGLTELNIKLEKGDNELIKKEILFRKYNKLKGNTEK